MDDEDGGVVTDANSYDLGEITSEGNAKRSCYWLIYLNHRFRVEIKHCVHDSNS